MKSCGFYARVMGQTISWTGCSHFLEYELVAWQPHGDGKTPRSRSPLVNLPHVIFTLKENKI